MQNDLYQLVKRKNRCKSLSEHQINSYNIRKAISLLNFPIQSEKEFNIKKAKRISQLAIMKRPEKAQRKFYDENLYLKIKKNDGIKKIIESNESSSQRSQDEINAQSNDSSLLNPNRIPINVRRVLLILHAEARLNLIKKKRESNT